MAQSPVWAPWGKGRGLPASPRDSQPQVTARGGSLGKHNPFHAPLTHLLPMMEPDEKPAAAAPVDAPPRRAGQRKYVAGRRQEDTGTDTGCRGAPHCPSRWEHSSAPQMLPCSGLSPCCNRGLAEEKPIQETALGCPKHRGSPRSLAVSLTARCQTVLPGLRGAQWECQPALSFRACVLPGFKGLSVPENQS